MLLEFPVEPPEPVPDPDPDPDPDPADEPEPVEPTEDEDPPPPPPPQEARIKKVTNRNVDPNLFINFSNIISIILLNLDFASFFDEILNVC